MAWSTSRPVTWSRSTTVERIWASTVSVARLGVRGTSPVAAATASSAGRPISGEAFSDRARPMTSVAAASSSSSVS